MNKTYNIVWSAARNMYVVASEFSRGDSQMKTQVRSVAAMVLLALSPINAQAAFTAEVTDATVTSEVVEQGTQNINNGGVAITTVVNTKGIQKVYSGGTTSGTLINSGGWQYVSSGGIAISSTADRGHQTILSGGIATSTTIEDFGYQYVSGGGSATNTIINEYGFQRISQNGIASDTTINGGNQEIYSGGTATGTTINNKGEQFVSSGGFATDTTVNSGGTQHLAAGGSATSTTISKGGQQNVYSSGTVADTTVNGGDQYLFDGGTATGTTLNGVDSSQFIYENSIATDTTLNNARQFVSSGGTAINTTINNGSDQQVLAGGIAIESLNNSGGQLRVSSGGSATKVTNKGMLLVLDGGTATEVNQAVGAGLITSTDATVKGTNVNGAFSIDAASHTASNVLLENSASLSVNNSGTATNTTVNRKGTLSVSSGGVLAGNTLINEGGTLKGQNSAVVNQGILTMDGEQGTQNWSLQGSGSLVKTGDGSLTMTRGGTYSGGTVISGGTLNANDLKALGSGDIDNSATLNLNAFGTYVAGDVTTHNGGVTSLAAGTMLDATSLNQQDGSTLNITLGNGVTSPVITADTVNIDGSLNITGIGNISAPLSHDPYTFTLIDADNSITGNFDNITIGGMDAGMVDFMTIGGKISATDDSQYVLTSTLTWYADISHLSTDAHGTFTLSGPGDRFELNTALADVVPNSTTGWDGKTLTKAGEGTLILNASNTYSGDTYVNGGTLIAGTDNALGTDGGLVLASGATFELNGMSQSSNYLRSDAGSTLKLDGGELVLGRNIHQTSEISGTVTGSGLLDIYGSLDIDEESDLSGLSATIDIEQYADVYSWNAALGTGNIVVDGTLQMNAPAGELSNNLSGSGSIWAESALTVSGDNDDFSGTWTIRKDSSLTVMNAPALGTGNVVDGGALYLGGTDNWALNSGNVISDYAMYDGDNLVDASAGKVVKQDANTITITNANSYSGGTLIEKGTLNADHVAALGTGDVDNHATLNLNAVGQYVLANFTTYSAGTTSLVAGSTLAVDAFVQQDDSTLNISLAPDATSPLVIADSASLDGTLNITGIGNIKDPLTHDPYTFTLIDADSAISGDFEELTVAGIEAKETDFLTVDSRINPADDTQYELTTSLSWYADVDNAATDAHGTFTLSNPDGSFTLNTALTDVDANSSTGWDGKTLTKAGDGTLILNVSNTYSGDTYVNGGTLVAGADNALGTDGGLVLASGATFDLNGMSQSSDYLRSDVGSTLNLDGGELVLGRDIHQTSEISGTVTGSGLLDIYGSLDIDEESDLSGLSATIDIEQYADVYSWNAALGTGKIVVDGTLYMDAPAGELSNNLSGSGSIWAKSALTVSGDNDDFSGTWTIGKDSSLTVMNAPALGTGNVVDGGALYLGGTDNWALNSGNVISDYAMYDGDNLVDASAGKVVKQDANTITIANANTYSGGTVVEDGTLNADNVAALGVGDVDNHATLNLNAVGQYALANFTTYSAGTTSLVAGSMLAVDAFVQQDDSTLNISLAPDATSPIITADSASLDGTLNITGIGNIKDPLTHDPYTFTLIDADSAISGDFEELTVAGIDAKETDFLTVDSRINPADDTQYELTTSLSWYADVDNAATDAHGTFTLSNPDGSFTLNTALTDVDANSSTGWDGKTLTKAGEGTLILNASNTYSGDTYVNGGTLIAGADNALGTDGGLVLASGATFDLNGMSQSSDYLRSDVGSTLNLDGGELVLGRDIHQTSEISGTVTGSGLLDIYGSLDIDEESDLSGLSATIDIEQYADVYSWNAALGTGNIVVDGTLYMDAPAGELSNNLSGSGSIWAKSALTVSGDNDDFSGTWTIGKDSSLTVMNAPVLGTGNVVDGGTLYLGGTEDWTLNSGNVISDYAMYDGNNLVDASAGKVVKQDANTITIANSNTYSGETRVSEGTLWLTDTGVIGAPDASGQGAVNVDSGATFGGSGVVNGDVYNGGNIAMSHEGETDNTLTINGNYTGDNGNLYLNTQLGDDSSPTDKLVISGDTSGNTTVYVANVNGKGAQTKNGIEVIDVGGQSDGTFEQGNQVQIGLYEYRLYEDGGDWYLRSQSTVPPQPDDGGDVPPVPDDDDTPVTPQYRPDIGVYVGNQWMVRNLQMQTLYDREGSQYRNEDGSVWMRFKAGNAQSQAADGHVDIDNNYSQFQLGGDILAWGNGEQSLKVGMMASYINADTDSEGNRGADGSQFRATGNVDGYNLGVYATWFADAQNHQGAYVDSWYQYGFYNNSVQNGDVGTEGYDSTAQAVSLEGGYRYDIALENQNIISITPQAQVVWQRYDADSVLDNNGTRIDDQDSDNWNTRLGLRVDGKLHRNATSIIQPFAEVNWLYTSGDVSVSFDGAEVKQDIPSNRAQAKVGIQANLDSQWSITGQVVGETGSHNYNDLNGSLNLRYSW